MVGEVGMLDASSEHSSDASAGSRAARYLVSMLLEGKGWGRRWGAKTEPSKVRGQRIVMVLCCSAVVVIVYR